MVRIVAMIILILVSGISYGKYGRVNAIEYDTSYIDKHKEDAMSFLKDVEVGKLEKTMNENYFDCKEIKEEERDKYEKCREEASKMKESAINAKEQEYKSYNLKRKGEEWAEQGGSTGEGMSKAEKDASEAFLNVHNNKGAALAVNSYQEINKEMALGNEITKNPMVRVNSKHESANGETLEGGECAVSDREDGADEVKLEEYEEIIEDTEIEEEGHVCEKDVRGPFYCEEKLEDVGCKEKVPCDFNQRGEGGLFEGCGSGNLAHATNGQPWNYRNGILSFGEESAWTYGYSDNGSESCLATSFEAKFCIKDKSLVEEFEIVEIHENNVLDIYFNGRLIRDGEVEARRAKGSYYCWYKAGHTAWDNFYYDLKPYLREGENIISIKLKYTKGGHAGVKIRAKAYCCAKRGQDKWQGDCPR